IKIRGSDQQPASPRMFMRDLFQKILVDEARDDLCKRCVAGESLPAEQPSYWLLRYQLISRISCVDLLQCRIIAGSKKGEWRRQGTSANSSDDVEFGTIASRGPPHQKTRAERPVGTTPGNREKANLRSCPLLQQIWPRGLDLGPLLRRQSIYV